MIRRTFIFICTLVSVYCCRAQDTVLHCQILNPSFETVAYRNYGVVYHKAKWTTDWFDCGQDGESPPNLHTKNDGLFGVKLAPAEGKKFVSLVTRYSDTWEGMSQKLERKFEAQKEYFFWISLAKSEKFLSMTRRSDPKNIPASMESFTDDVVLRVYLGNKKCRKRQLIYQTNPIGHTEWLDYKIHFIPNDNYEFISLEAYYKQNEIPRYNGNILIDDLSVIMTIRSS